MKGLLVKLHARFDLCSTRERIALLLGVILLFAGLWDRVAIQPRQAQRRDLTADVETYRTRTAELEQQRQTLEAQFEDDEQDRMLEELRRAIVTAETMLDDSAHHFIPPDEWVDLLGALLQEHPGISLKEMEAITPKSNAEAVDLLDAQRSLTSHGVRIEIEAGFVDTLHFLRQLEELPWTLYWDQLDYSVATYPRARVRFVVHTLKMPEAYPGA